ncbi:MAG: hypothetical protein IJH79_09730 [Lentisphaeria bacterium]|nr:hypothetical protein [Lentisphaeria bacterium]
MDLAIVIRTLEIHKDVLTLQSGAGDRLRIAPLPGSRNGYAVYEKGRVALLEPHPCKHRPILSQIGFADPNMTGKVFNAPRDENGHEYPLQLLMAGSTFGPAG